MKIIKVLCVLVLASMFLVGCDSGGSMGGKPDEEKASQ